MEVDVRIEAPELDRSTIIGPAQSNPEAISAHSQQQSDMNASVFSSNLAAACAVSNPPETETSPAEPNQIKHSKSFFFY
jgi:hypothetical protein